MAAAAPCCRIPNTADHSCGTTTAAVLWVPEVSAAIIAVSKLKMCIVGALVNTCKPQNTAAVVSGVV